MTTDKKLVTIKKAAQETGSAQSFFKRLMASGELTRYKIHRRTFVSLTEFEALASSSTQPQS